MILNWFWWKKMETRHPVWGSFGSEFPAICNNCAGADLGTGATGAPPPFGRVIRKFLILIMQRLWCNFLYSIPHFRFRCGVSLVEDTFACLGLRRIVTVAFLRRVQIFLLIILLTWVGCMRDTTESRLAQTRCKYKNCAKIKSELSTKHMTFTSPERFLGRF